MSAELIIDAAARTDMEIDAAPRTDMEIEAALKSLRSGRVSRIQQADREIPILYADIQAVEGRIKHYRRDREWCVESLKTLDRRLAEMEE